MLPRSRNTMQVSTEWALTMQVQKITVLKRYKEPSVPIRAGRKMQWPALWGSYQLNTVTSHSDPSKSFALVLKWTGSRAREGNSWTHALIMLYFRWYPVVSHFNNPPQLDVLVPSARQCLVIGPGWEPCWGLTSSTLMESTMRDTRPIFIVFPPLPGVFSFSEPDGAPWVLRLPQAGVRAGHGREGSHLDLSAL